MGSIPVTAALVFVRLTWLPTLWVFFLAVSMPALILAALKAKGAWFPEDQAMVVVHTVFLFTAAVLFALPGLFSSLQPQTLFLLPVSGSFIAVFVLVMTGALVFVQACAYGLILNAIFGLNWPVIGPAGFLGVSVVSWLAFFWAFGRCLWLMPALIALLTMEFLFLKSRYGPLLGSPQHFWSSIDLGEWAALAAVLVVSLILGCHAVAWNRCGDSISTKTLESWLKALLSWEWRFLVPSKSPYLAHFWAEWHGKGWLLPVGVAAAIPSTLLVWSLTDRSLPHLDTLWFLGGYFLSVLGGLAGVQLGQYSTTDPSHGMGTYMASRPMTSTALAWVALWVGGVSLIVSWLVWLTGFGLVRLALEVFQEVPLTSTTRQFVWWYLPGTFLSAWVAMGSTMVLVAWGRRPIQVFAPLGIFLLWMVGTLVCSWSPQFLSPETYQYGFAWLLSFFLSGLGLYCLIGATRSGLVGQGLALIGLGVWLFLAWGVWVGWDRLGPGEAFSETWRVLVVGAASLVVLPWFAGPLAVKANRVG